MTEKIVTTIIDSTNLFNMYPPLGTKLVAFYIRFPVDSQHINSSDNYATLRG